MSDYTLAQIKAHPNFPFSDFEDDDRSFLMLELYWAQLFYEAIKENRQDWACLTKAEMDGNPIFTATSLLLKRQLTIIQKVNRSQKPVYPGTRGEGAFYGLQVWRNNGSTIDGTTSLNELVLYADVSSETEQEALRFIKLHCIDLEDEQVLERAIIAYEKRVNMPE
ncbi:hypothetical protein [Dyadobacter fanqingshengii]|uniref:Uncharacterized protein n=1 Tax=Dyadobacter fanqingshengii TaxID=2906443 RepID=A0A9X1PHB0_9BACT|nr:hypothetical protein [Dyadobacter fanqingshengii]MCF0043635.1 hypothetical protein [Dyadobacter fanqingshengii]USJ34749.1 hypothetical protein NFI81_18800 [Dyadobacter fanqingshengii]